MKILSIMCDMVRPNILDFENCGEETYENMLKTLGGTYYCNCFSHGPDTGRSMGCYWSGVNPQENGCNTRAKYPKFYLQKPTFLDTLVEEKFKLYFFTNPNEKVLGVLPPRYENIGVHNDDLDFEKFANKVDMSDENVYIHASLTDFHWALDDYGANADGVEKGLRVLKESISNFFDVIPSEKFDYIIIFSDHGFKYDVEFERQEKYLLLNRDRSNTLMFLHKKGDSKFDVNEKLCSIIDVFPTVFQMIGKVYNGDGYSLFSEMEHEFIISEEHGSFRPQVNQRIEYWAVIKKDVIYLRSYSGYYRDDGKSFERSKEDFDKFLGEHSASFKESLKQLQILELYKVMASDKSIYTNGEPRYVIGKYDVIKRLRRKISRNKKRKK